MAKESKTDMYRNAYHADSPCPYCDRQGTSFCDLCIHQKVGKPVLSEKYMLSDLPVGAEFTHVNGCNAHKVVLNCKCGVTHAEILETGDVTTFSSNLVVRYRGKGREMSKFKVECKEIEDNYDSRTELIVTHNGKEILRERDGGEPEDNYFFRDWGWVEGAIMKAYELGLADGRSE